MQNNDDVMRVHLYNGCNEPSDEFVEIDGNKFKVDPDKEGEALKDNDGKPIPFTEKKKDDDKGGGGNEEDVDAKTASLDELKKLNPNVAKLLEDNSGLKKKVTDNETADAEAKRKKAEADGKWQDIATEETGKRKKAESETTKLSELVGKYKGTVAGLLESVMKTIPKDKQSLIPSDFSDRRKLDYITNNAEALGAKVNSSKGSGVPSNDDDVTDAGKMRTKLTELTGKKDRTMAEDNEMMELAGKIKKAEADADQS